MGHLSRLASPSSATFAQRRRDAKAGTGLARPDLKKLQLGCQQRLTNAEAERWATSPFISLIHFRDENRMRFLYGLIWGEWLILGLAVRNLRGCLTTKPAG